MASDQSAAGPDEPQPFGLSRRTFLRGTTLTAAAVGVAGSVPGLSGLLAGAPSAAPEVEQSVIGAESDAAGLSDPLVAHVKDLATGEISLFQGEREIVIRDPGLALRLASSAHP
jgi:TAT (twin-arginine translocation) pathway signal sequence